MSSKEDEGRFPFGRNWQHFVNSLDEDRIIRATHSLIRMLGLVNLEGKSFLDVGCGSGLYSLAARHIGARVVSFDLDPHSVACAKELKRRYFPDDYNWKVERGSVLDESYLRSLGQFDVVYSWGVLHHTGDLWPSLRNVAPLVSEGGKLFIAIYNDQGGASRRWAVVKRLYNKYPQPMKFMIVLSLGAFFELRSALIKTIRLQNPLPFKDWRERTEDRGMSTWTDLVDWVGGYPFEVAKPEDIFDFFREKGFVLERLKTCGGGHGCNEFVFQRNP